MIWLYIYLAGGVLYLVGHGAFGSWQDDGLASLTAFIWPLFIPVVLMRIPIFAARWAAENYNAIAMEARRAEAAKRGSVHEGAGLQGIAQPQSLSPKKESDNG